MISFTYESARGDINTTRKGKQTLETHLKVLEQVKQAGKVKQQQGRARLVKGQRR